MEYRPWQSWQEWLVAFILLVCAALLVFVFLVSNGAFIPSH